MRERKPSVCDRDCFNCQYPDCICDEMTASDYREARIVDDYINPQSLRQQQIAAKQREYYKANREQIAAKQREYYKANREQIAAKQREYYKANRAGSVSDGDRLMSSRIRAGLTQRDAASLLGTSQTYISRAESGRAPVKYGWIARLDDLTIMMEV